MAPLGGTCGVLSLQLCLRRWTAEIRKRSSWSSRPWMRSSEHKGKGGTLSSVAPSKPRTSSLVREAELEHGPTNDHGRNRTAQRHLPLFHDVPFGLSARDPPRARDAARPAARSLLRSRNNQLRCTAAWLTDDRDRCRARGCRRHPREASCADARRSY